MKKYYIGLLVIGLVTLGLAIYILSIGMQAKGDKKTYEKANEIAEKLNDYVSEERKVPENLQEAGVTDAPDSISYEKISDEQYKFCVTYKASKGYGSGDITSSLTGAALSNLYGSSYDYDYGDDYKASYLYINYYYQKGENCQTIEPVSVGSSYDTDYWQDDSSDSDDSSSSDSSLYETYCSEESTRMYFEEYCANLESGGDGSFGTDEL